MENIKNKLIIAITGPSGAGKTTLVNNLSTRLNIAVPRHCTTRLQRKDDQEGAYRYLSHDEYAYFLKTGDFLISSGDGPEVKKEYGNFYGILKQDCSDSWNKNDIIVLFVSYKDIDALSQLRNDGFNIEIVALTFTNIEKGVKYRLTNDPLRNHTEKDINSRIRCALSDTEKYEKALQRYAKTIVYTDMLDIEGTYEKVCSDLGLRR